MNACQEKMYEHGIVDTAVPTIKTIPVFSNYRWYNKGSISTKCNN